MDRVRVKGSSRQRIGEATELAYKLSGGFAHFTTEDGFDWLASERLVCVDTGESFPELTPRSFSFNSPEGACPTCGGLGVTQDYVPELVVPEAELSLQDGAIAAWGRAEGAFYQRELAILAGSLKVNLEAPWSKLPKATRERVLFGDAPAKTGKGTGYEGVIPGLKRRSHEFGRRKRAEDLAETLQYLEEELQRYARETACPECHGSRLNALARHVTVQGETLPSLCSRSLASLGAYLSELSSPNLKNPVTERLLRDIGSRVTALLDLGLDYLSLDRSASTLSGGEVERIRLATQIGSGLVSVLYVLDEPSAGLHARDNERLVASLERLRDQGNSVLVVEHDEATIRAADHVIDLGPGAGVQGGRVIAQGGPGEIARVAESPTGAYLSGRTRIKTPSRRRVPSQWLELRGARLHNLKDVSVRLPIAALSCVTGVSGSGKSSLIVDTLLPAAKGVLRGEMPLGVELRGAERFDRVIEVDQAPIGRTPRSSPASYVGAFDDIRELFATLPEARARAYGPARFSFNVKGGRCEVCKGDGLVRVDMQFLPDVFVVCESCGGQRYDRETLEVRYRGYSVADVLRMSIQDARELFAPVPKLAAKLAALSEVGLGYLALGQPANTLSGGEAQRIKLARELARKVTGRTLLVLDEPTTGLHFQDVALLIELLDRLVAAGNTVIVVEHQLDLIRCADFVLDMGPEGGPRGGEVVAAGTPEEVAREARSHTGHYLARALAEAS
ncbi:MAG: excinuclease ABC subunit UvrA [Myxococcales bacterium]